MRTEDECACSATQLVMEIAFKLAPFRRMKEERKSLNSSMTRAVLVLVPCRPLLLVEPNVKSGES